MQSFVRVLEMNSFSAVAREQKTTQPTISKQIAALEKYLGVQLITRSTTNLSLTEEGKKYYQYCQRILETIAEAEASLTAKPQASGILRLGCPVLFGQMQIVPRLKLFMEYYPDVKIDLMMADHFVDIIESGLDLIIRIGSQLDHSLISHHIGTTRRVTVATKRYFEEAGKPEVPHDLIQHNCIVYTHLSTSNEWHFRDQNSTKNYPEQEQIIKVPVSGCFQTNSSVAVRAAVLSDLGIAVTPIWMFGDEIDRGDVQIVLQDYQPTSLPICGVYRRSRFYPAKITCFIDFLATQFKFDSKVS
jgi:DNA-binding transcriptional LysR family regulator